MVSTDLLYLGRSPYGTSDDFAITFANFVASIGTATATASTIPRWDANVNLSANNFLPSYATTATAAALTTLVVGSAYYQYLTVSTTQTVKMPVTSTLALGQSRYIVNNSSGAVTVESSGANSIQVMAANSSMLITCISLSGTTAASWNAQYYVDSDVSGAVLLNPGAAQTIATYPLNVPGSIYSPGILDSNGNPILTFITTASAVNYLQIYNNATNSPPAFSATGSDTDIGMTFVAKGAGTFSIQTTATTSQIVINTGTAYQHATNWNYPSSSASQTITVPDATGTILITGQAINSVPSITFSSTSGVIGTTTNNNAAAGSVGEFISSVITQGSPVTLTNGATTDLTSISLTAGDWDVWGNISIVSAGTANTELLSWTSIASATQPDFSLLAGFNANGGTFVLGTATGITVPYARYSLSGTTTIYISASFAGGTGNGTACGGIYARRVR